MATEGAAPPPPGVVPDFENPHGAVHLWTILTQLLCIPIVTIFVGLRICTKIFLINRMYAEDCTCGPSIMFVCSLMGACRPC
jgi:hypothetical protein